MRTVVFSWIILYILSKLFEHCGTESEGGDDGPKADGVLSQSRVVGRNVGSVLGGFVKGFRQGLRSGIDGDEKK